MKIYRVSQDQQAVLQEVIAAITNINSSIATINQALKELEQTNTLELFKRNNLINAIQSGNVAALDLNNINRSLTAMSNIVRAVPVINNSLRIIQENEDVAKTVNVNANVIQTSMIKALQVGDFQQFQSMLAGFKANLPAISNTQSY